MNFDVRDVIPSFLALFFMLGMVVSRSAIAGILPKDLKAGSVQMPRAWLGVVDALTVAHTQTGVRYAVVAPQFQGTIGPYRLQEPVSLEKLLQAVADASDCTVRQLGNVVVFDPKPPLERNCDIVLDGDLLIATPHGYQEEMRSGTWYTIRQARKRGKKIIIVWPNGSQTCE